MTGNQRYWPGNQTVDQFAERNVRAKPMLPESIQACHKENVADTGSNVMELKSCLLEEPRQAALVKMIEMPRGIQLEPPAAK